MRFLRVQPRMTNGHGPSALIGMKMCQYLEVKVCCHNLRSAFVVDPDRDAI